MKKLLCAVILLAISIKLFAQDNPTAGYYNLKTSSGTIKIYQSARDKDGKILSQPDTAVFNFWNSARKYNYHFKTDIGYTFTDKKKKYLRITIPAGNRWDPVSKQTINDPDNLPNFDNPAKWTKSGDNVDSQDFNSWLWISQDDFDKLKQEYYLPFQGTFVFSGITTPLKYRFAFNDHASSILNGDVNLGTFLGWRFVNRPGTAGLSLGIFGGVSSLPMNSSNNTSSTLKTSAAGTGTSTTTSSVNNTGLNYGTAFVIDVSKKFQVGVIAGWDHAVGDIGRTYLYQDRMWLGFSLNFKFLDFGATGKDTQSGTSGDKSAKAKN